MGINYEKVFRVGDRIVTSHFKDNGIVTKVINNNKVYCLFEDGSCGVMHTSEIDLHEPRNNYASDLIVLFNKMGVTFKEENYE